MKNLTPMNESHLTATMRWLQNSEDLLRRIDCLTPPRSAEENEKYWRRNWDDAKRRDFAIVDANRTHVGNCGLSNIDFSRKKAELWIYLGESREAGIGTNSVNELLHLAFAIHNLRRVYVRVLETNGRALNFYKKLGFVEEGLFRNDTWWGEQPVSSIVLSMLDLEWSSKTD